MIHGLSLANVQVNRKVLSDIAINHPEDFTAYCNIAKDAINGKVAHVEVKKVVKVETKKVEAEIESFPVDYAKMLVKDLKAIAEDKGIEDAQKMLKADLVKALENL